MFVLTGRNALVTGAGQGVGLEIALVLASAGAAVAVNDIAADRVEAAVERISLEGGVAVPAVADLCDADAIGQMVGDLEQGTGPIDILVNNAGIPPGGLNAKPFIESSPDAWAPVMDLNIISVLHLAHRVVPGMVGRGWGRVITIVSDAARTGEPTLAVYGAAKAAAAAFSRSLAQEVGPDGVTCNCVALGSIVNPIRVPADLERAVRRYPMRRLGEPSDVAPLVLYLASDESSWVTAQTYAVDGGYVPS